MDIKEASIDELKAELKRRERGGARVIEIPGPNGNGSYGVNDPDLVSVWAEPCERQHLDPARVARAASLCLCMEDFIVDKCQEVPFGGEAGLLHGWLLDMLAEELPTESCAKAARAAGWID